ncbi:MAG: alpha/beta fold hydrolase [Actinomycetota bacterium]|nr:alpha/beta fold hydrolase [Actinomycetota bacterium]
MPTCKSNGIELHYETHGQEDDPALLLVMGLGAQMIAWDEEFCDALVDRGFFVIRYDNRDVGLSSKIEGGGGSFLESFAKAQQGEAITAPYLLTDMAADAMGLLDHLGIERAHVVGASMGGMIAQTIAIEHPERVRSLTSIMSTTGDPDVGQPTPEAMARLLVAPPSDRASAIEASVASTKVIGSPDHYDEDRARRKAAETYDRAFTPAGTARQLLAIMASGSRAEALARLDVPTVVIHGDVDPLVTPTGGARTAQLIPGAEHLVIEGMGHDLPPALWPQVVEAITAVARRAPA